MAIKRSGKNVKHLNNGTKIESNRSLSSIAKGVHIKQAFLYVRKVG